VTSLVRTTLATLALTCGLWGTPAQAQAGPQRTPREAALITFRILQQQDWKALYSACAFSETVAESLPKTPQEFADEVTRGIVTSGGKDKLDQFLGGMKDLAVGEPQVTGDLASVPTSFTITLNEKVFHFRGIARLVRRQHAWLWDLSFSDDVQKATEKAFSEMLGKPDPPAR
jgi:hypothetical protein